MDKQPRVKQGATDLLRPSTSSVFVWAACITAGMTILEAVHETGRSTPPAAAFAALTLGFLALAGLRLYKRLTIVRQLKFAADQIAEGQLVPAMKLPQRGELRVMVGAFNEVVIVLGKIMKVIDRMSLGDFTTTVRPRSERDNIAQAFVRMTQELSTHISEIQRSGIQLNVSLNEIAATSKQQHATAVETAATTNQVVATTREITLTSRELVRTITDVAAAASESARLAQSGKNGLREMDDSIQMILEASTSITATLSLLSDKASRVNGVVATITKVADQTNLLSFNAAIEAEKAGEYGRGFAVVATEIRRLADQTAVSIYDIESIVKDIQAAVAATLMHMDQLAGRVREGSTRVRAVGAHLGEIMDHSHALAPRIGEVNEGMTAQAAGADQIMQALEQLGEASRQTVDSLRQSTQAIASLDDVAGQLRQGVSRFKTLTA